MTKFIIIIAFFAVIFLAGCESIYNTEFSPVQDKEVSSEINQIDQFQTSQGINLGKSFERKFIWNYGDYEWHLTLNFYPGIYEIYKNRSRERNYDLFASDPYDDEILKNIVDTLTKVGKDNGLDDSEIPYLITSFVQSLPYTSDEVTAGFDEYPRFPYETLYDDGGDCEDTSILASALLQEKGYGVILIQFEEHMAVGVKCSSDVAGAYFMYKGDRYCYLETTGENWDIGMLPDEFKNQEAKLIEVTKKPVLDIHFESNYKYDTSNLYADVDVTVKNLGSEIAKNAKIYVALQTANESKVWDHTESGYLQIEPEDAYEFHVKNLHAPSGQDFRIYVRAYGDNVISDEVVSDWVSWTSH